MIQNCKQFLASSAQQRAVVCIILVLLKTVALIQARIKLGFVHGPGFMIDHVGPAL